MSIEKSMSRSVTEDGSPFSERAKWQSWLDVEAALAFTQAEMGIIPRSAGLKIVDNAKLDIIGVERLREKIDQTMAPVYALSECLAESCGKEGDYVHWGATTQNIVETGRLLVLQGVQRKVLNSLSSTLARLSTLARTHAATVMVGRTNRQNALPITFGFKIAGWIDELLRVRDQLKEIEPRLFQLRFGGAVGGFHSLGVEGIELSSSLARRLSLYESLVPNRTSTDPLIEYITRLSMIGVACSRISDELYLLMTEEIAEVYEVLDNKVVGSSTMPHKINPKFIVELSTLSIQLRSKGAAAFSIPSPSHEGDAVSNKLLGVLVEETCLLSLTTLDKLHASLTRIKPDEARMRTNYQRSREMMATEGLMMNLASSVGRGRAHDMIHQLVARAKSNGTSLQEVIYQDEAVVSALGKEGIVDKLSLDENIGQCESLALKASSACDELHTTCAEL